jgi:hypothetical protein
MIQAPGGSCRALSSRLVDLRDLTERDGGTAAFEHRLTVLQAAHTRKPSLMERLDLAGFGCTQAAWGEVRRSTCDAAEIQSWVQSRPGRT